MSPKVSVIIPAFNQAAYLGEALQSVLAQTEQGWEAIVVDDASSDATAEVAVAFADPRIRYLRNPHNQERSRSRNTGLQLARGDFVSFLDADDFWAPQFLEKQLALLAACPQAGFSFCGYYDTTSTGRPVRVRKYPEAGCLDRRQFLKALLMANRISIGTVVMRSAVLRNVGGFDEELRQGEDWDLWLRVASTFAPAATPEPLLYYRRQNDFTPRRLLHRNVAQAYPAIVARAFERLNLPEYEALRPAALARVHWLVAWNFLAVGQVADFQAHMSAAHSLHPAFFQPPYSEVVESIAYLADELYDLATPVAEAEACVRRLFDHLPAWAGGLRRLRSQTQGQVFGVAVFSAFERGDLDGAWQALGSALRHKPAWLLNRGFAAIAARALLRKLR